MRLEWTRLAVGDLKSARAFLAEENKRAASAMAARVLEATEALLEFPNLGRTGRLQHTRELVVTGTPFLLIYRVRGNAVQVLRVLHHALKWP